VTFDIIKAFFWYQWLTWSHGLRIRTISYEGLPWWRGKGAPLIPLYKPHHEGEFNTSGLRELLEELSYPLPYAPPLFLSSSWLSSHISICASELEETPHNGRCCAAGFPVQILLLHCSTELEPGRRLYAVRVRVLRGTACAALCRCTGVVTLASWRRGAAALWRRVLHDFEVGYVGFIINACAGGVIPAFGLWDTYSSLN
jgi:hypothetical protein